MADGFLRKGILRLFADANFATQTAQDDKEERLRCPTEEMAFIVRFGRTHGSVPTFITKRPIKSKHYIYKWDWLNSDEPSSRKRADSDD